MSHPHPYRKRRSRRGSMISYLALSLPVIGIFSAFGVEIAYAHVVRQQLQTAADAAGHAALQALDGTAAGLVAAKTEAKRVADGHLVDGRAYAFDNADIELGYVGQGGVWVTSNDPLLVTSVRVTPVEPVGLGLGKWFLGRELNVTVCGAVTTGEGNAVLPGDAQGGDGVENGKVTVRIGSGIAPGKYESAYDDDGDTTVVDLFAPTHPLDAIADIIGPNTPFKINVVNTDLSPGGWLNVNGTVHDVEVYDDTPFANLLTYSLSGAPGTVQLTELDMSFGIDAIKNCELHPTSNGSSTSGKNGINGEWSGGVLTVQLVKPTAVPEAGTSAGDQMAVTSAANVLYQAKFWWEWHQGHYDNQGNHAADWTEDYAKLDCNPTEFIDSSGPAICL